MKSQISLLRVVLNELGTRCGTSTDRDLKTITVRVENEGFSFLTITLPTFCRDFEKSLDIGRVDSSLFLSFKKRGCLPVFLQGFTSLVFSREDGRLLDDPSDDAIHAVRQICLMFGKINLPCSQSRVDAAIEGFVKREQTIRHYDSQRTKEDLVRFGSMAHKIWGGVFARIDSDIAEYRITPKHGPGSTAERVLGNKKYSHAVWTDRLEAVFPAGEMLFPSWSHFCEATYVDWLEPGQELPVRVVTVPKTLKTPRIIAIEPVCMQYVQQGILESYMKAIKTDPVLSHLVGFDDQLPNQQMAKEGSLYGNLATLDLSEASDSVSNQLVREMLRPWLHLSEGVDACRSRKADIPGHGVKRLAKFASMGSALCFPMEATVFLTVILLGIERALNRPLTYADFQSFVGKVRVYGDDIIVPVEFVQSVVEELQAFGFEVNSNKSFWTGKFRESCGKEYYNGEDVSIVRVREVFPTQRKHVRGIVSTVSLRNQFYFSGLWETTRYMDELIERLIPFPTVHPDSAALGRHSLMGYESQRECPALQRALVKAYVPVAKLPPDYLEGPGALLKWFLKRGDQPFADRNHLERAGRPDAVNIKLRWVSPV